MKLLTNIELYEILNEDSKGRIILISQNLTGHRIHYLKALLAELSQRQFSLVLILQNKILYGLDASQISTIDKMDFSYIDNFVEKSEIMKLLDDCSVHEFNIKILFWDADNWIRFLLFFKGNVRLLFMRPYLTSRRPASIIKYFLKWVAIFHLHFIRKLEIGILGIPYHEPKILPSLWLDDPVLASPKSAISETDTLLTKKKLGIEPQSQVILVPGYLTSRKNPQLAISVFERVSKQLVKPPYLVFAGKTDLICQEEILTSKQQNIIHVNRFLSDSEYSRILSISTIVLLPYSNRGSSAVALESLAYGKSTIITKFRSWQNAERNSKGLLHLCDLNSKKLSNKIIQIFHSESYSGNVILSGVKRDSAIAFLSK